MLICLVTANIWGGGGHRHIHPIETKSWGGAIALLTCPYLIMALYHSMATPYNMSLSYNGLIS